MNISTVEFLAQASKDSTSTKGTKVKTLVQKAQSKTKFKLEKDPSCKVQTNMILNLNKIVWKNLWVHSSNSIYNKFK